jgi:hypothetical protein
MFRLRISTHDRRAPADRPVALLDAATDTIVCCYRSVSAAARHGELLQQLTPFGESVELLNSLAADATEQRFGCTISSLTWHQARDVVSAVQSELKFREQLRNQQP